MKEKENTRMRMPKILPPDLYSMYQLQHIPHRAPEKGRGLWMMTSAGGNRRMQQASSLGCVGLVGVTREFLPFLRLPSGDAEPGTSCSE